VDYRPGQFGGILVLGVVKVIVIMRAFCKIPGFILVDLENVSPHPGDPSDLKSFDLWIS